MESVQRVLGPLIPMISNIIIIIMKMMMITTTTTTTIIIIIIIIIIMMMMMMMMMMMILILIRIMMMMIIMIIIIELKGAIRDFYFVITAPRTVSTTHAQVTRAQSCTNHVQHTERSSRAKCRVPLPTKGQLSC